MTREEAIKKAINIVAYCEAHFAKSKESREDAANIIEALEQDLCEDWHDVPSDEMTLEQARQAVRGLRKIWAEHLEQEPCTDAVSRQAVIDLCKNMVEKSELVDVAYEVRRLPSVSPARPKGKWISDRLISTSGGTYGVRRCSECEAYYQDVGYGWNFCPNCGADMRNKQNLEYADNDTAYYGLQSAT